MKKLIFFVLAIAPFTSFAFNFITTPFELLTEVKDNRKAILKIQQNNYCNEYPKRDALELEKLEANTTKTDDQMNKITLILNNKKVYKDKCNEVEKQLLSWEYYTINTNQNFTCGSNYIKRGDLCITPTEACEFYFGKNITGQVDISSVNVASCGCNEGYEMKNNQCVLKAQQTASVVSADTKALQELIVSLMAQVQALMAQLQARNY